MHAYKCVRMRERLLLYNISRPMHLRFVMVVEGGMVRVGVSSQYQRALRKPTAAGHEWVVELPVDTRLGDDVAYRTGNRSCHTSRKKRSRWGSR